MNESMTQNTQEQVSLLPNMSARVYPVNDPKQEKGCVLANASVDLGGCFAVTGIKIVEGKDGPFVVMPQRMGRDKKYRDVCFPTTAAVGGFHTGAGYPAHHTGQCRPAEPGAHENDSLRLG